MAKKHKKFKKKISQNLSERIAQIQLEEKAAAPAAQTQESKSASTAETNQVVVDKYAYVKKDIRRDFVIILVLILLLTGVTVLNSNTAYLKDFASWIYTILNLKV